MQRPLSERRPGVVLGRQQERVGARGHAAQLGEVRRSAPRQMHQREKSRQFECKGDDQTHTMSFGYLLSPHCNWPFLVESQAFPLGSVATCGCTTTLVPSADFVKGPQPLAPSFAKCGNTAKQSKSPFWPPRSREKKKEQKIENQNSTNTTARKLRRTRSHFCLRRSLQLKRTRCLAEAVPIAEPCLYGFHTFKRKLSHFSGYGNCEAVIHFNLQEYTPKTRVHEIRSVLQVKTYLPGWVAHAALKPGRVRFPPAPLNISSIAFASVAASTSATSPA